MDFAVIRSIRTTTLELRSLNASQRLVDAMRRKSKEAVSEPFAITWPLIQAVSIVRCLSWAVVTKANDERKNVAGFNVKGPSKHFSSWAVPAVRRKLEPNRGAKLFFRLR
jgi:hypothetical protein